MADRAATPDSGLPEIFALAGNLPVRRRNIKRGGDFVCRTFRSDCRQGSRPALGAPLMRLSNILMHFTEVQD